MSAPAESPVAVCSALADNTRWEILQRLGRGDASASELAEEFPVTRQAIARHLQVLSDVGLVEAHREGRQLRYRALGLPLSRLAENLDAIARGWERRLDRLKRLAEEQAGSS